MQLLHRNSSTKLPASDDKSSDIKEKFSGDDGLGIQGTSSGSWNVLYLFLNHKQFPICEDLPKTVNAIKNIFPRHYSHAFVSALVPGTNIIPHYGPSNRMLRVWLPLDGCDEGDALLDPPSDCMKVKP